MSLHATPEAMAALSEARRRESSVLLLVGGGLALPVFDHGAHCGWRRIDGTQELLPIAVPRVVAAHADGRLTYPDGRILYPGGRPARQAPRTGLRGYH